MENQETAQRVVLEKEESNGLAVASLVLGIVGLVIGLVPFIGWFMLPAWILAVIFGFIGRNKQVQKGLATTGLVLGIVTIVYKFGFWIFVGVGAA